MSLVFPEVTDLFLSSQITDVHYLFIPLLEADIREVIPKLFRWFVLPVDYESDNILIGHGSGVNLRVSHGS